MGASSSTSVAGKELANEILNDIFLNEDISLYLDLLDTNGCSAFVRKYQSQLMRKTARLNVFPYTSKGNAIFQIDAGTNAPQGQGLQQQQEMRQYKDSERNAFCFEVANVFSKILQVCAALFPNLMDISISRQSVIRGGNRITKRIQRGGGGISSSSNVGKLLKSTILWPFIMLADSQLLSPSSSESSATEYYFSLNLSTGGQTGIRFKVPSGSIKDDTISVQGEIYQSAKQVGECNLSFTLDPNRPIYNKSVMFSINDETIITFTQLGEQWSYEDIIGNTEQSMRSGSSPSSLKATLIKEIKRIINLSSEPSVTGTGYRLASGSAGITSGGKSFFIPAVKDMRTLLNEIYLKKKKAPIALAIARALILLYPLDPKDSMGKPYQYTQLCKKVYTLGEKDAYIPKKGKFLKDTPYFKSLLMLYYDIPDANYKWTMRSESERELMEASKDLYYVYNYSSSKKDDPTKGATFLHLEKGTPIPSFDKRLCPDTFDGNYKVLGPALTQIHSVVDGLLKVQREYEVTANNILLSLFTFTTVDGKTKVNFNPTLLQGNTLVKIQTILETTRRFLLSYYMKVEMQYIAGSMIYEKAIGTPALVPE